MDIKEHTVEKIYDKNPKCPDCQKPLKALLFMGTTLDGYVCESCRVVFNVDDLTPLGRIF